jgi:hypothetical protein
VSAAGGSFPFVQLEFGFLLGPRDGRYLVRAAAGKEPEHVLVLTTLGAPERRRVRGRRGAVAQDTEAAPEPVPTSRVTVITPTPFDNREAAAGWLERLRKGPDGPAEVDAGVSVINRALHAYRAAEADHSARDIGPHQALVVRVGYGNGDAVAAGRYDEAWELPSVRRGPPRRSMEAPEERFAALLGARESVLVCEELVLRARADLDAGRLREAALQARAALESLLAELGSELRDDRHAALEADRQPVSRAAGAALGGAPSGELSQAVEEAVGRMEGALRARRLSSAS